MEPSQTPPYSFYSAWSTPPLICPSFCFIYGQAHYYYEFFEDKALFLFFPCIPEKLAEHPIHRSKRRDGSEFCLFRSRKSLGILWTSQFLLPAHLKPDLKPQNLVSLYPAFRKPAGSPCGPLLLFLSHCYGRGIHVQDCSVGFFTGVSALVAGAGDLSSGCVQSPGLGGGCGEHAEH